MNCTKIVSQLDLAILQSVQINKNDLKGICRKMLNIHGNSCLKVKLIQLVSRSLPNTQNKLLKPGFTKGATKSIFTNALNCLAIFYFPPEESFTANIFLIWLVLCWCYKIVFL